MSRQLRSEKLLLKTFFPNSRATVVAGFEARRLKLSTPETVLVSVQTIVAKEGWRNEVLALLEDHASKIKNSLRGIITLLVMESLSDENTAFVWSRSLSKKHADSQINSLKRVLDNAEEIVAEVKLEEFIEVTGFVGK